MAIVESAATCERPAHDTEGVSSMQVKSIICQVSACTNPHYGRGWCRKHYLRWYRQGSPLLRAELSPSHIPFRTQLPLRFWSKVQATTTCWNWTGTVLTTGYGQLASTHEKKQPPHRLAYEDWVAPIAAGLTIDHLCRNTLCVRPDHLEPVTGRINTLRGTGPSARNAQKTHCIRGHRLAGANLYRFPSKPATWRICRRCASEMIHE